MQPTHDPYAPFRYRDYRLLTAANFLAIVGNQIQTVGLGYELYQRTREPIALGYVGLVQFVPIVLLSLPAGHAADHYDRKLLLMVAQIGMAIASLGLAAFSFWDGPIAAAYGLLLLAGVGQAFRFPARWALVPLVVPESILASAITWNSSAWQLASVLGPAMGGLLIAAGGSNAVLAFGMAACCSVACTALVHAVRPREVNRPRESLSLASLLAGAKFVCRTRLILATLTLDLFAVLFGGATALLPVFAQDILQVGPVELGWLYAAPSVGAMIMALTLSHLPPMRRAGRTLLIAVTGFGAATIVFGFSEWLPLSLLMLGLTGALDNISVLVRGTLVQLLTPDAMRGRVSSVNAIFINSSNQLGAYESGLTAQWFTPVTSVVIGGIGTILSVAAAVFIWPELLRLGALNQSLIPPEPAPEEIAEEATPAPG